MFVYFDNNGVIREVINDKAIRVGNINANNIYIYIDGVTPDDLFVTTQWGDLTKTNEISIIDNVVNLEIPYDKNRDMKFFKNFKTYKFYVYKLGKVTNEGENVTAIGSDGLARTSIRITADAGQLFTMGTLTYNIEESIIKDDFSITQSQYDYLLSLVARNNLEIESIRYNAPRVTPISVAAIPDSNILKVHAVNNFSVEKMYSHINSENIEDMWFGCGIETSSPVGFALNYDDAKIGKLQVLINSNYYGDDITLNCYVTNKERKYLADAITLPPMAKGVFAFYRFNVYDTGISRIEILQEESWKRDRFYIKSIESFELTGTGEYLIIQKNGIISNIDNPDTNYLDKIYQYMRNNFYKLDENVAITNENAQISTIKAEQIQESINEVTPILNEGIEASKEIKEDAQNVKNDLKEAKNTLKQFNDELNKPGGFLQLGADGLIPASKIPVEKTIEMFAINDENDLITLSLANVGDVAYSLERVGDEYMATHNWRLVQEPFSERENWVLQATTYSSVSAYAEKCGLAENSSLINGIKIEKKSSADFENLVDKTGIYIVTM